MGLAHYTKTGPSRVSCIDVFISWSSGAERPGHCGVGSGLQWRLHLLCYISSRLNGIFIWCSISLFYLIFFWQFLRFVWLPLYVQWYWSDDERITATIWSMIWFLVFKSLMTYFLPLLVFLSLSWLPFLFRLWICAGCDEEKIGPCFWFSVTDNHLYSSSDPSSTFGWFCAYVFACLSSNVCHSLRWWIMNKLRMSDFGDAFGIHEKMFHKTEQCRYSFHV